MTLPRWRHWHRSGWSASAPQTRCPATISSSFRLVAAANEYRVQLRDLSGGKPRAAPASTQSLASVHMRTRIIETTARSIRWSGRVELRKCSGNAQGQTS